MLAAYCTLSPFGVSCKVIHCKWNCISPLPNGVFLFKIVHVMPPALQAFCFVSANSFFFLIFSLYCVGFLEFLILPASSSFLLYPKISAMQLWEFCFHITMLYFILIIDQLLSAKCYYYRKNLFIRTFPITIPS